MSVRSTSLYFPPKCHVTLSGRLMDSPEEMFTVKVLLPKGC